MTDGFSRWLKSHRKMAGLSQAALEAKIGKNSGYIAKLEGCHLGPPSKDVCRRLTQALGAPAGQAWVNAAPLRLLYSDRDLWDWHLKVVAEAHVESYAALPGDIEERLLNHIRPHVLVADAVAGEGAGERVLGYVLAALDHEEPPTKGVSAAYAALIDAEDRGGPLNGAYRAIQAAERSHEIRMPRLTTNWLFDLVGQLRPSIIEVGRILDAARREAEYLLLLRGEALDDDEA